MKQSETTDTIVVRTETVHDNGFTYRYVLSLDRHSPHCPALYSIRAELTRDSGETESAEVRDAFADPGHALIFFSLCHEHLVSPRHLTEILSDFER